MRDCESREFVFTSVTPKPYFIGRSIILLIERSNRRLRQRGSDNPIAHVFQWSHEEHRLLPMRVLTKLCPSSRQAGIAGIILNLQMETAPTGCSSPSERIAKRFSMKRSFQSLMFYSRPALLAPPKTKPRLSYRQFTFRLERAQHIHGIGVIRSPGSSRRTQFGHLCNNSGRSDAARRTPRPSQSIQWRIVT